MKTKHSSIKVTKREKQGQRIHFAPLIQFDSLNFLPKKDFFCLENACFSNMIISCRMRWRCLLDVPRPAASRQLGRPVGTEGGHATPTAAPRGLLFGAKVP